MISDGRYVGGDALTGAVEAIRPDSIIISHRQHAPIIVRRERIDAVEAVEADCGRGPMWSVTLNARINRRLS